MSLHYSCKGDRGMYERLFSIAILMVAGGARAGD